MTATFGQRVNRQRRRGSRGGRIAKLRRRQVFTRDYFHCRDCNRCFGHWDERWYDGHDIPGLTLGHIIPASMGGSFTPINLITQCWDCNSELADEIWLAPRYPNGRPT